MVRSYKKDAILDYFSAYGRLHSFRRVYNKDYTESGYAFFEIDAHRAADFIQKPHVIRNALINCKIAADNTRISVSQKDEMERKLYVSNLPPNSSDLDLLYMFEPFGKLTKAYLVRNREDGSCKNFGFVIFQRKNDLDRLLEDPPVLRFRHRKVTIKKAVDRQTQKFKLNSQPTGQIVGARRQPSKELNGSTKTQILKRTLQLNEAESNYHFNHPDDRRMVETQDHDLESGRCTCNSFDQRYNFLSTNTCPMIGLHN